MPRMKSRRVGELSLPLRGASEIVMAATLGDYPVAPVNQR
jgi:hypothetical protein